MSRNCRFAVAVHVCAVLAANGGKPATSEYIANSVNTNPVVIRRILSALARAGVVRSWRGSTGGSVLARCPDAIPLLTLYRAVDDSEGPALHHQPPNPNCPVGANILPVLGTVIGQAESAFEGSLGEITLADVMRQIDARIEAA